MVSLSLLQENTDNIDFIQTWSLETIEGMGWLDIQGEPAHVVTLEDTLTPTLPPTDIDPAQWGFDD